MLLLLADRLAVVVSGCTQMIRLPRFLSPSRTLPATSAMTAGPRGPAGLEQLRHPRQTAGDVLRLDTSRGVLASSVPAATFWPSCHLEVRPLRDEVGARSTLPAASPMMICGCRSPLCSMIVRRSMPVDASFSFRRVSPSLMSIVLHFPASSAMIGIGVRVPLAQHLARPPPARR